MGNIPNYIIYPRRHILLMRIKMDKVLKTVTKKRPNE